MSAHLDDLVADLAGKLQGGATKDEVERFLENVDPESREYVLAEARKQAGFDEPGHEGGTEGDVGDLTGPGAGYDDEPVQVKDGGGVG
jgi:hypothetical protein